MSKKTDSHPINLSQANDFFYSVIDSSPKVLPNSINFFIDSDNDRFEKDPLITYITNSYGFRSDEFDKDDVKDNFLFSGCSATYGMGVPYDSSWGYQLNQNIGGGKFYNISAPGLSIQHIIFNTITFLEKFGSPRGIFMYLPEYYRQMEVKHSNSGEVYSGITFIEANEELRRKESVLYFYYLIKMLESICEARNVPLTWSAWHTETTYLIENDPGLDFKYYVGLTGGIKQKEFNETAFKDSIGYYRYWKVSRDKEHPGIREHSAIAGIMESSFKNNEK